MLSNLETKHHPWVIRNCHFVGENLSNIGVYVFKFTFYQSSNKHFITCCTTWHPINVQWLLVEGNGDGKWIEDVLSEWCVLDWALWQNQWGINGMASNLKASSFKFLYWYHAINYSFYPGPLDVISKECPFLDIPSAITLCCPQEKSTVFPLPLLPSYRHHYLKLCSLSVVCLLSSPVRAMIGGTLSYSVMCFLFWEEGEVHGRFSANVSWMNAWIIWKETV